ncbi:MAG: hypothetical protein V9H25_02340 [Candidatus Competibacter sp.]
MRDLLQHSNKGLVVAAHAALQQMVEDDSLKVRTVVAEILKACVDEKPLPTKPQEPATGKAKARPTLPTIQNVHGWSTQQVQTLQQQTAQALGLAVEFCDRLQDGSQGPTDGGDSRRPFSDGLAAGRAGVGETTNANTRSKLRRSRWANTP